jgi:mannose-6-phosphate isomerase-like protein (cupin superfamily)
MHDQDDTKTTAAERLPTRFVPSASSGGDGPACRTLLPAPAGGWTEPAIFEWELRGESWSDRHPHSEYNFVIEGELFVEAAGVVVRAGAGEVVKVPADVAGRYWAPRYARLLAIYGPSKGEPSRVLGYQKL